MRYTTSRCAAGDVEETFDRYVKTVEQDPRVQIINEHIRICIGRIRDVLSRGQDTAEALSLLDELDDEYINQNTEMLKVLAKVGFDDIRIAYELGLKACWLEKRRDRLRQFGPDGEKRR